MKGTSFETTDESRFDWVLLGLVFLIMCVGLFNIDSATANKVVGTRTHEMVMRQLIHFGAGLGLVGVIMLFDYRLIERLTYFIYGFNLIALALVEFIGKLRYGARRWLDLGFMAYQPSETMKIAVILALARYFHQRNLGTKLGLKELIGPGLILGIPALLTIAQPDLGTGGHMLIGGTILILFVGVKPRLLITAALLGIISFPAAWQYGLKEYQRDRIRTFLDPMADPKGEGYNAIQAMIAVGSGGIKGKGYGKGTQTQLDYTPEGHTDFIFTVLAEEWGFIGCSILLSLYLFLMYRCVQIASLARDQFGSLVCVGIIGMLSSQICINIAMVCGMFPIVGIPLPLLSYGGSSVINVCVALGILLNVGYKRTIF